MKRPFSSFYVGVLQGAVILATIDKYGIGLSISQRMLYWIVGIVLINIVWMGVLLLDYLAGRDE